MELQSLLAEFEILKEYDQVLSHVSSLFHELLHSRAVLECRYSLRLVLFPSMVFLDYQMESKQLELCHFVLKKTRDLLDCGMDDIQPIENSLQLIDDKLSYTTGPNGGNRCSARNNFGTNLWTSAPNVNFGTNWIFSSSESW